MYKKMRKNGKGKEKNEEKWEKIKKLKGKMSNVREKGLKEAEDLFFSLFYHF